MLPKKAFPLSCVAAVCSVFTLHHHDVRPGFILLEPSVLAAAWLCEVLHDTVLGGVCGSLSCSNLSLANNFVPAGLRLVVD